MAESTLENINPILYECNYLLCYSELNRKITSKMPYFLYVHKGKGQFIIEDTVYNCSSGDLFFCAYNRTNTIIADKDDPFLLSGIDFEFVKDVPDFIAPSVYKEYININNHLQFQWLLMEIINRKSTIDIKYFEYTQSIFKAWLILVGNLSNDHPNLSLAESISVFLSKNINRNLSLVEIADVFKYHPNHLNRVFKSRYGITLKQYHDDLRIKEAIQLLSYSNYSVNEISLICGYEDVSYFSRIFKSKTNFSPTKYRNKNY